jgi:4-hydroxy-3-methylbut-2-enyl diphosphate reductase IspH
MRHLLEASFLLALAAALFTQHAKGHNSICRARQARQVAAAALA